MPRINQISICYSTPNLKCQNSYLLEVAPQIVDGRQAQLVRNVLFLDFHMVLIQQILIVLLVSDVEHQPDVKGGLVAFHALFLGLVVELQGVQAA